jgi:hypothetical protein
VKTIQERKIVLRGSGILHGQRLSHRVDRDDRSTCLYVVAYFQYPPSGWVRIDISKVVSAVVLPGSRLCAAAVEEAVAKCYIRTQPRITSSLRRSLEIPSAWSISMVVDNEHTE